MADKRLAKLLAAFVVLLAASVSLTFSTIIVLLALDGRIPHTDFFGIWSWARLEIERSAALVYDHAAQYAFLLTLDPSFPARVPCPYPPLYLLLIRPLGQLSYPVAYTLWSAVTLLAYLAAVCAPAWRLRVVLTALLAPATALNLVYGQNGFLTTALMVGGVRLAPSRPVAGGALLGLLAYKPQFAFLVVIALIAARWWRTALAAAFTIGAWAAATLVAFGFEPWTAWLRATPDYLAIQHSLLDKMLPLMPTPMANALSFGAGADLAGAIQLAVTAAAAAAVWYAFTLARPGPSFASSPTRGGAGTADRAAVLATASILATPYALTYDTTLVGAAVALVVAEYWTTLSAVDTLVLACAALIPVARMLEVAPPVNAAAHALLLALILLRLRRAAFPASGGDVTGGPSQNTVASQAFPAQTLPIIDGDSSARGGRMRFATSTNVLASTGSFSAAE